MLCLWLPTGLKGPFRAEGWYLLFAFFPLSLSLSILEGEGECLGIV